MPVARTANALGLRRGHVLDSRRRAECWRRRGRVRIPARHDGRRRTTTDGEYGAGSCGRWIPPRCARRDGRPNGRIDAAARGCESGGCAGRVASGWRIAGSRCETSRRCRPAKLRRTPSEPSCGTAARCAVARAPAAARRHVLTCAATRWRRWPLAVPVAASDRLRGAQFAAVVVSRCARIRIRLTVAATAANAVAV